MPRIVKEEEYARRRKEILDAAQRLIYTKGYEQMTIQDLLEALQISKGAFYHYFDSKPALLEALIERVADEGEQVILPIVLDESLPALVKFRRFYDTIARWNTDRKDFFLGLLRSWYADDNAIVRQKTQFTAVSRFTPHFAKIIHQGIQEGVLNSPYPDQAAEIGYALMISLGDALSFQLLSAESADCILESMEITLAAYTNALESVLGAPPGSLPLMDASRLKEWVVVTQNIHEDLIA